MASDDSGPPNMPASRRTPSMLFWFQTNAPAKVAHIRPPSANSNAGFACILIEKERGDEAGESRGERVSAADLADGTGGNIEGAQRKSGPSGITIMKSRMLTN